MLEALLEIFPEAHVYTLLYSRECTAGKFHANIYKTSTMDFGLARRKHRLFIPLMPSAMKSLRPREKYDLIISDSAGYAKGIPHDRSTFHLSYCYTPLRYAWEIDNYFYNPVFKTVFRPAFEYLRRWDFKAAQKPDVMLAVSRFIAAKIDRYYGRSAAVVYPPVDYRIFYREHTSPGFDELNGYYLAAGRLLHYKRFDLLVEAFRKTEQQLVIVGMGPESERVFNGANGSKNIRYLRTVGDAALRSLYCGAAAVLFPQVEDFGLVAAEAQACGTPVIAFGVGGALEIVQDGITGLFFYEQTPEAVLDAIHRFEKMSFDRDLISRKSQRFGMETFKKGLLESIPEEILNR